MADVYSAICFGGLNGKTVTFTDAGDIVNLTNHGLRSGQDVFFTNSGGGLPTGLSSNTLYYARQGADVNKFTLHSSKAKAIAGTDQVTFTGTGSGTNKVFSGRVFTGADLSRYGNTRVYDSWSGYLANRGTVSAYDTEYCEFLDAFTDNYGTSGGITVNLGTAKTIFTSRVNGTRGLAYHNGNIPKTTDTPLTLTLDHGYALCAPASGYLSGYLLTLNRYRDTIDGLTFLSAANGGTYGLVKLSGGQSRIAFCNVTQLLGSLAGDGITPANALTEVVGCRIINCSGAGLQIVPSQSGIFMCNNVIAKCATGVMSTASAKGFLYNNIVVGNTTNWNPSTTPGGLEGASNNCTPTGQGWSVSGGSLINIGTGDFADYTNNNFYPASGGSPQVESGISPYGYPTEDIAGRERPNYMNGGAEAMDIGADEYDHGYGNHPSSNSRGLAFTGLVAGSKVKVFVSGTDTEKFSVSSSSTSETWSETVSGSITVDYVILRAGYLPIRVTNVVVTASDSGTVATPITQVVARWYQASSGLTLNTNCFANATTKKFGLTAVSTLQNLASYLLEQWITLGDTGEAYANKPFPLEANGPNSFSWLDGWEADLSTYSSTVTNLRSDGMRYITSGGTINAVWIALMTVGIPSGLQMRYQQVEGAAPTNAATTGDVNQLIQVYSNGVYDYTGYLVCKVQAEGYDQAEVNVVTQYGTLEDQLYVIALNPQANSVAAGNPTVSSVTITDHGASPVTWNSKVFSITITDAGTTPGLDIIQWIRHALAAGSTFQSKNGFNWHDLVQTNGTKYKGVRGILYGDVGASLKGVRILRGTDPHPDFTLHTADDGTTVDTTPAEAATGSVSGIVSGSRLQVYNVTTATEMYNAVVGGTTYSTSYNNGTGYTAGDVVRVRLTYCSGTTAKLPAEYFTIAASGGWSVLASQENDTVYIDNGIDGSTVTEYASDYVNVQIDISDPDNTTTIQRGYAWYCYQMTLIDGIRYFFDAFIAEDAYNYLLNTDVADIKVQNTGASGVTLTGGALRRKDGSSPIASGGSVYMYYGRAYSDVVTVSGSNVVTGDLADIAPAVWGHGTRTLTSGGGGGASADDVWNHSKALSVGKFLGLK